MVTNSLPIVFTNIFLDTENPRHDASGSQPELMEAMVQSQNRKLLKLAEDIVENGLGPEPFYVMPYDSSRDKFIVLEGNRRLTALKLLHNPSSLPESTQPFFKKKIKELSKKFSKKPISEVQCIVFNNRAAARRWIELKHTGENEGAGTVAWDAISKRRFEAFKKGHTPELQVIEFILKEGNLDEAQKKLFAAIPVTTVKRLIDMPEVRKALGLYKKENDLLTSATKAEIRSALMEFFAPFATGEKKVGDVYYREQRLNYLKRFPEELRPDLKSATREPWKLLAPPKDTEKKADSGASYKATIRSKPLSTRRQTLIPPNFHLKIEHKRLNKIYQELKNLELDEYQNAGAVLLRVFLECSLDVYIDKNRIKIKKDVLYEKIKGVADHLEDNGLMSQDQLKPVRVAADKQYQHGLFSTNTLNAYIHNKDIQPNANELKTTWDNMELFMQTLWS